jgi:hypothetical protein
VVRPGSAWEPLFGESAQAGFILEFHFHIHDHYFVFIPFQYNFDFFFTSLFFGILSTWSPTYLYNFSILIPYRTSSIEFQSVLQHSGMWPKQKKKKKKTLTLIILRSVKSKILKISPLLWFNVKCNILWLKVNFLIFLIFFGFKKKISVLEVEIGKNGLGILGVKLGWVSWMEHGIRFGFLVERAWSTVGFWEEEILCTIVWF